MYLCFVYSCLVYIYRGRREDATYFGLGATAPGLPTPNFHKTGHFNLFNFGNRTCNTPRTYIR